jgi:hypothetical protein
MAVDFQSVVTTANPLPTKDDTLKDIAVDNPLYVQLTDGSVVLATKLNVHSNEKELLVNMSGHICEDNTTTTPLLADATFTGEWQDTLDYGVIVIGLIADQDSATDGLVVQWSANGISVTQTDIFTITANNGKVFTFGPANQYIRVVYTNGGTDQGTFNLQTILKRTFVKPSSHRIQDSIVAEDDAELTKSVLTAENPTGTFINIQATASNNLRVTNAEDGLAIAKGDVTGTTFIHKFGEAPDFDTGDNEVTIWDGADDTDVDQMNYVYSTSADIDSISSSDGGDTQNIEIQGLDSDYNLVTQTITLTGQTRKALTTDLIRVFRMVNRNSTNNAGHIYCYVNTTLSSGAPVDTTKIRAIIQPGNNQTLMAVYTIPNNKTGYLRDWYASSSGASRDTNYIIKLVARPTGEVFQVKHKSAISDSASSYIQHVYVEPEKFVEKTDIELRCQITAAAITGGAVSAGFDIVLIDD